MDARLYKALKELDDVLVEFLRLNGIEVEQLTPRQIIFVCTNCDGMFRFVLGGMHCEGCGQFVEIRSETGEVLTLLELYQYAKSIDDKAA